MGQARGQQFALTLYEESSYNTDPGSPSGQKIYVVTMGVKAAKGRVQNATLNGRVPGKPAPANINVSGPLVTYVNPESIGTLLKHAIGSVNDSGADPYTHTFTPGDLPTGFILEKDFGGSVASTARYEKFGGCRMNSLNLIMPKEGWPTLNFDVLGASRAFGSAPLDATPDDNGATPFHMHESSLNEGGASIAVVTNGNIQIANNLVTDNYTVGNDGERYNAPEGFAVISGSITALFEDKTLLDKAINDTDTSLKIVLTRGDGGGTAGNEEFSLEVQNMLYEEDSPPIDGPAGIMQTLNFHGYLSGANTGIEAILKNAVATV